MKLELGSGDNPTPGYVHLDIRPLKNVDIVGDAAHLIEIVGGESCDEIKANHILEHFSWQLTTEILFGWKFALKPGGLIHIEVPNMKWQADAYSRGEINDKEYVYFTFGGQDYPGNTHYAAFSGELLYVKLDEVGFKNIKIKDIGQVLIAEANRCE